MSDVIHYDPNNRFGKHTVELTFAQWDYALTVTVEVHGNCKGFSVLSSGLSHYGVQLFEEQGKEPILVLRRPSQDGNGEDELECYVDEDIDAYLEQMCVGIRLVSFEPETCATIDKLGRTT